MREVGGTPRPLALIGFLRFGGFHIGMGTPELICEGKIKMHSGPIKRVHEKEVPHSYGIVRSETHRASSDCVFV